jgi:CRP-like cAMP-binding protein
MTDFRIMILCADEDQESLDALTAALDGITGELCSVESFRNGGRLRGRAAELAAKGTPVPVVFVDETLGDGLGVDTLIALAGAEHGRPIRKALLSGGAEPAATARAIRAKALDSTITKPWTQAQLQATLHRLVTQYFVDEQPHVLERVPDLVDVEVLSHAFARSDERERAAVEQLEGLRRSFLGDQELPDEVVEQEMIEEIDRVLTSPPRDTYPSGTVILHQGDPVDGVLIVLEGKVRLFRDVEGQEVVFHHRTAGRIIGLLALARSQPAFYDVQATTDTTVLPLSLEQLNEALHGSPSLAIHFATVLVRSLARRNLRSTELQIERDMLARELQRERDQLAAALERPARGAPTPQRDGAGAGLAAEAAALEEAARRLEAHFVGEVEPVHLLGEIRDAVDRINTLLQPGS